MEIEYPIGGYAPGNYVGTCTACKEEFIGDKRAVQCEPCAINMVNKYYGKNIIELNKLKKALSDIKFSNDVINEILGNNN